MQEVLLMSLGGMQIKQMVLKVKSPFCFTQINLCLSDSQLEFGDEFDTSGCSGLSSAEFKNVLVNF